MKVIYIAGPYRDKRGVWYIQENIRQAEHAAIFVWKFGGIALCPHKNTAFFDGAWDIADSVWLSGDLELLKRCDAVYAIPGWAHSHGASSEVTYARTLDIPVLTNELDVINFLK